MKGPSVDKTGTLYGLGVGPGDPKLVTVGAIEVLRSVNVVFTARSSKNDYSLALEIIEPYLPAGTETRPLDFPMTADRRRLTEAWQKNARQVLDVLRTGRDAAFITLGDPLTYSTYGYLIRTIRGLAPEVKIETVAGVTSYAAAAARLNLPLAEGKQALMILSGTNDLGDIERLAPDVDTMVILKAYRNYDEIVDTLARLPGQWQTHLVSRCGLPGEAVAEDAAQKRGSRQHYLSLVIAQKKEDEPA